MELYGLSKIVGWKGSGLPTPDYNPQLFLSSGFVPAFEQDTDLKKQITNQK